jgi:HEAT repeat protein
MTTAAEVTTVLAPDYSVDAWYDDARLRAGQALSALPADEWRALAASAPEQPAGWRIRLAQALLLEPEPRAVELLVDLLRSPESSVAAAAAETLLDKRYHWDPATPLRAELERHLVHAAPGERPPLERLAARVGGDSG